MVEVILGGRVILWLALLLTSTAAGRLASERVPGKPCTFSVRPDATSARIYWDPPCSSKIRVKGYVIGYGERIADVIKRTISKKAREYHIRHLKPSTEYIISLRAYNKLGDGVPLYRTVVTLPETRSQRMQESTILVPPIGVRAVMTGPHTATVIWMDPMLGRDQIMTDKRIYTVRYKEVGNSHYMIRRALKDGAVIDNLIADTRYEFEVKTMVGGRESSWSMAVMNKTFGAVPGDSPHDITIIPIPDNPTQVLVTWQPPRLPNGFIESYVVYYTADASAPIREWSYIGLKGDRLNGRVKELTPDTLYHFKAQVRNGWGFGPISDAVSYRTPKALDIPVDIKAIPLTPNALLLTWRYPPHNVRTTTYRVQCQVKALGLDRIVETNKQYALFENLAADEEYFCFMNMIDGSTVGGRSNTIRATPTGF